MQAWMLDYVACPGCSGGGLVVEREDEVRLLPTDGAPESVLVQGILGCRHCARLYPVMDEAPRLLTTERLTAAEKDHLRSSPRQVVDGGTAGQLTSGQLDTLLRQRILKDYRNPAGGPSLRRALADIAYHQSYADRRIYQMRLLQELIPGRVETVLDVGGGSGGNLAAAARVFPLRYGIVADLNPDLATSFQTGDRKIAFVRADATCLPFRSRCFQLVISSFLIEHVREWREVVGEVARVGANAFVGFGPNRSFPVELGHLDAPLAHCLPVELGTLVAYAWGMLTGNRRSYRAISEILRGMNYVRSQEYFRYCREVGLPCSNIFEEVFTAWAQSSRTGVRGWLGKNPALTSGIARTLVSLGVEPNVYSLVAAASQPRA